MRRNGNTVHDPQGRRLLWMWNPTTGEHAYYDVSNDVFLSADEGTAALAM